MLRGSGLAILLLVAGAGYSQQTGKPNLSGNWKLDLAHSELDEQIGGIQLAIEQKGDQTVHLVETEVEPNGRESKIEFTCSPGGKECPLEVDGRKGKVTLWYNGPVLVELQTSGRNEQATKRRMKLSGDGQKLEVEVVHIEPQKKTEKLLFSKG